MHDLLNLPTQRRSPAGVLPVVAAVESVRYLREQLDLLTIATAGERDQLRHEIALLRQWLQCTETESGDYQATVDGLARFAAPGGGTAGRGRRGGHRHSRSGRAVLRARLGAATNLRALEIVRST